MQEDHEFSRIERAPTYRLVYDAIERQILAGRLRVGDPLPAEIQSYTVYAAALPANAARKADADALIAAIRSSAGEKVIAEKGMMPAVAKTQ